MFTDNVYPSLPHGEIFHKNICFIIIIFQKHISNLGKIKV